MGCSTGWMNDAFRAVCYRGGLSSLAIQPTASVFRGSMGKETFWIRWQVLHSKVRSSKPRLPGVIRANPILCLQVGLDGRSAIEMVMTQFTAHTKGDSVTYRL